jgi:hypothetical protein
MVAEIDLTRSSFENGLCLAGERVKCEHAARACALAIHPQTKDSEEQFLIVVSVLSAVIPEYPWPVDNSYLAAIITYGVHGHFG